MDNQTRRIGSRSTVTTQALALATGIFAFHSQTTHAATIRHDANDADYIALGQSPEYSSVGSFLSDQSFAGSAILIAQDWVLTAAHLFRFASSGTFTIGGTTYSSSALITHPQWTGNAFNGYDFGLMHLSTSVNGINPALLYSGNSELGQVGTYVGYGITGTGLTGFQLGVDGNVRGFNNVIDGDIGIPGGLVSDFDNPLNPADSDFGSSTPLPLEGCVANGDSGGGVFITVDNATYLAGIISFVAGRDGANNSDYGDITGFNRVSTVLPWIFGTTGIPEPASGAIILLGAGVLWFQRSRRN